MRYKLILIFLSIFMLSGCTLKYNLSVDEDGFVEESATVIETKENLLKYTLDISTYTEELLDGIKENDNYNSYILSVDDDSYNGYGYGNRTYLDLENYKNKSIIVYEMFEDVSIAKSNNMINITMIPKDSFSYFEDNSLYNAVLDEVYISINVPYEVISNNADEIEDNVYTWHISKDKDLKTINILYDTNNIVNKPISLTTWILIGVGSIIFLTGIYILIKYKRNNI